MRLTWVCHLARVLYQLPCAWCRSQAMTTRLTAVTSLLHPGWQEGPWSGRMTVWSQGTADTGGDRRKPSWQVHGHACHSFHLSPHQVPSHKWCWGNTETEGEMCNIQYVNIQYNWTKWCRKCYCPYWCNIIVMWAEYSSRCQTRWFCPVEVV